MYSFMRSGNDVTSMLERRGQITKSLEWNGVLSREVQQQLIAKEPRKTPPEWKRQTPSDQLPSQMEYWGAL